MYNRHSNEELAEKHSNKTGLTPRELIHYHMNNPDVPISDEDIENLVLKTDDNTPTLDFPADTAADAAGNSMLNNK